VQDLERLADRAVLLGHGLDLLVHVLQKDHSLVIEYLENCAELQSWSVFLWNTERQFLPPLLDVLLGAGALCPAVASVLLALQFRRVPLLAQR
jgi:hypothetical protein